MPTDNDARAELRLANEHRAADIKRKLADIDRRLRVLVRRRHPERDDRRTGRRNASINRGASWPRTARD